MSGPYAWRLPSRDSLKNPLKGLRRGPKPGPGDPYGLRTKPGRFTRGRVLRWVAYAALGWLLLSIDPELVRRRLDDLGPAA